MTTNKEAHTGETKRFKEISVYIKAKLKTFKTWFSIHDMNDVMPATLGKSSYWMVGAVLNKMAARGELDVDMTKKRHLFRMKGVKDEPAVASIEASPGAVVAMRARMIENVQAQLNALGMSFAIVDTDGTKYGTLSVVEAPSKNLLRWAGINKDVIGRLQEMKVGDVQEFVMPEGETFEDFDSAISYRANKVLGRPETNNTTYEKELSKDKKVIVILKVKDKDASIA